jgi:hypothetical protein
MVDFAARLMRLQRTMIEHSIDLMFLPPSANLHYVTGIGLNSFRNPRPTRCSQG